MPTAMETPPLYIQRMSKEYPFYLWLVSHHILGEIYSLTEVFYSSSDFTAFTPYYVYLVKLIDVLGQPIDLNQFENEHQTNPQLLAKLKQVVKPLRTFMATDEDSRMDKPKIGDRVEFVFRRITPIDNEDIGLNQYLLKARRL